MAALERGCEQVHAQVGVPSKAQLLCFLGGERRRDIWHRYAELETVRRPAHQPEPSLEGITTGSEAAIALLPLERTLRDVPARTGLDRGRACAVVVGIIGRRM